MFQILKIYILFHLFVLCVPQLLNTLLNDFNSELFNLMNLVRNFQDNNEALDLRLSPVLNSKQNTKNSYTELKRSGAKEYDFIIVGGGSAGSVIANRLSEITGWKILLLEVGGRPNIITKTTALALALPFTPYNWGFKSERQDNFQLGNKNGKMNYQRGRGLGGSSLINFMMYTRGHPNDYDTWSALGNPGWSYAEVYPYFLKSEMANNISVYNPKYHNTKGYLSVSNSFLTPSADIFLQAGNELGYPTIDYNGPELIGVSPIQTTTYKGQRHDTYSAFLEPIRSRRNLVIKSGSYVTKILINSNTKKAYGVRYVRNKRMYTALATKEVILSAGVLNSVKLLKLSGIGPKDELEKFGINVISDLKGVGENLHDHISLFISHVVNSSSLVINDFLTTKSISDYLTFRNGPFSTIALDGLGYMNSGVSDDIPSNVPDYEIIYSPIGLSTDYGAISRLTLNIDDEFYEKYYKPLYNLRVISFMPTLLRSKSTGSVRLKSKNPFNFPVMYGNYMTDPRDVKTLIAGIRLSIKFGKTKAFQSLNTRLYDMPTPGCESKPFDSDEYWECTIRTFGFSIYHQSGTCKMGPPDDPTAVVNHKLEVYGVTGLRIADTSVIPFALTAHTNAPAIMIGEKTSDIIKQFWGYN